MIVFRSTAAEGLPGREAEHFIAREFAAARRGRRVTLVMFGFSGFDEFTRDAGREAAGAALQEFGRLLNGLTRRMNLSARYGWRADTFLSVLSDANAAAAEGFVARIREAVAESCIPLPEIEAGIVEYGPDVATPEDFVKGAEHALAAARSVRPPAQSHPPGSMSQARPAGRRAPGTERTKTG